VLQFLGTIGHAIMVPLYYLTSGLLLLFHRLFNGLLHIPEGGSWALAIIGLTVVIRTALIPLFVKQIKNSRNMQMLQPRVKELQKKYGHDRERMTQETMKLYKETGTNPFASCLPLLLQMPIFFALFRTLNFATRSNPHPVGFLTKDDVLSLKSGTFLGLAKISDSIRTSQEWKTTTVTIALVVIMTITTFTTQRQLMRKNMPESAMSGPYAQQQKILLYVLPIAFAAGGIAFPIGVLLYWVTSNVWTMGQQFYVIRNNPTPGTPAFEAKKARDARRHPEGASTGTATLTAEPVVDPDPPVKRIQPKRESRSQRQSGQPKKSQPTTRAQPPKAQPAKKAQPGKRPQSGNPPAKRSSPGKKPAKRNRKKK
jgi:YidC/Oxa1 family membrane protein insertase